MQKTFEENEKIKFPPTKEWILIILTYIIAATLFFLVQAYPKQLATYPDELVYSQIAHTFLNHDGYSVHNVLVSIPNILYSILISPFFMGDNLFSGYSCVEIFNCLLMTSAIFPTYLMARSTLQTAKARMAVILVCICLPDLMMSGTLMSEVLYYPGSLWTFFFIWKLIDTSEIKKALTYSCIVGVLLYILYWNKAVALALLLALVVCYPIEFIYEKSQRKKTTVSLVLMSISFMITKFAVETFILSSGTNSPYTLTKSASWLSDPYVLLFICYCVIYNFLAVLLAFFVFPVLIPALNFKQLNVDLRKKYLVSVVYILISIGVISYLISSVENLGEVNIRIHLRYFAAVLVPLLIIFFWNLENKQICFVHISNQKWIGITTCSILILIAFITVFQGVGFSIVDCPLLTLYSHQITQQGHIYTAGAGEVIFQSRIILAKFFVIIIFIGGMYYLYLKKEKRHIISIFVLLFIMVNLSNCYSMKTLYETLYKITDEQYQEASQLNEYLNDLEGNKLVVTDGFNGILDKYLPTNINFVTTTELKDKTENGMIDFSKASFSSNYPSDPYPETEYHYIITDKSVYLKEDLYTKKILVPGVKDYVIYEIEPEHSASIFTKDIFPSGVNETIEIPINNMLFFTQQQTDDRGNFISVNGEGMLVYGPYCNIHAGTYLIKVDYDVIKETDNTTDSIGYIDVFSSSLQKQWIMEPVYIGKESISFEVNIDTDATDAELRFYAAIPGVTVSSATISRIA